MKTTFIIFWALMLGTQLSFAAGKIECKNFRATTTAQCATGLVVMAVEDLGYTHGFQLHVETVDSSNDVGVHEATISGSITNSEQTYQIKGEAEIVFNRVYDQKTGAITGYTCRLASHYGNHERDTNALLEIRTSGGAARLVHDPDFRKKCDR